MAEDAPPSPYLLKPSRPKAPTSKLTKFVEPCTLGVGVDGGWYKWRKMKKPK